jgi:hypothetical protein
MTQLKYGFSHDDRGLVVEVLRAAADRFNMLADDLEEDQDNPSKAAARVSNRLKSEDCRRLARAIEQDMMPRHPRRRGNPHGAYPRFAEDD